MRFAIAMLFGAGMMFAIGTGLKYQAVNEAEQEPEYRPRRPAWASTPVQDIPADGEPHSGAAHNHENAPVQQTSHFGPGQARSLAHQQSDDVLLTNLRDLQRQRLELERQQAHIEAQLVGGVTLASATQPERREVSTSDSYRQRVLAESYRKLSTESITSIVEGLVKGDRIESAVSVLKILDDRKKAKVLSGIAGMRPEVALTLTERLLDQRTR